MARFTRFPAGLRLAYRNPQLTLYDSYHCSRYNTQTRRLTADMFEQVFANICADFAAHQKTGE